MVFAKQFMYVIQCRFYPHIDFVFIHLNFCVHFVLPIYVFILFCDHVFECVVDFSLYAWFAIANGFSVYLCTICCSFCVFVKCLI